MDSGTSSVCCTSILCLGGILYRPCVPCCVHLWVASIQWTTCAVAMDLRYPEHRRGGNLYVSTVLVAPPKPSLTVMCVIAVPLFRREDRADARGAFLQLGTIDDARTELSILDGRAGPGGEMVQVGLTRAPVVHPNWLWRWAYEVEKETDVLVRRKQEEKRTLRVSWRGFGFGTGKEEQGAQGEGVGD